jgi:transposase
MRLKHCLEQGMSQPAIARELGISRRTICRWINSGELDRELEAPARYGPRRPLPRKLDPYRAYVRQRLDAFPELTAVRLLAEIRASGYTGGITQLKDFIQEVRSVREPEPVVRFETPPGRQG